MSATQQAIELARAAAAAAAGKKGSNIEALDVSEKMALTDIFLVISADNERQVGAVVDAVDEAVRGLGGKAVRREGEQQNQWVLLDYTDIIVHVQQPEVRQTYSLERLWKDCPLIDLQLPAAPEGQDAE